MYILGLIGVSGKKGHDAAAALYKNGKIVAAVEEERFTRKRHAYNQSPVNSVKYCLDYTGITLNDVDYITCGWMETLGEGGNEEKLGEWIVKSDVLTETILPKSIFKYTVTPKIYFVKHHIAHLCSVYYTSDFESSAFIIVDGAGENESTTVGKINDEELTIIKSWPMGNSLGLFYDAAVAYSGLEYNSAGKFMGLTSFGSESHFSSSVTNIDVLNNENEELKKFEDVKSVISFWINKFSQHFYPYFQGKKEDVFYYIDFAYKIQKILEDELLWLCESLKESTESDNLVISGGVSLNCVANSVIEESNLFSNLHVQPAANDAGCSFGSIFALCRYLNLPIDRSFTPYLGPESLRGEIDITNMEDITVQLLSDSELVNKVANDLAQDKIVAWFQGKAEIGPRALGNRSILSNPTNRNNLLKVNTLKSRENWRPLAPSVLEENMSDVFLKFNSKSSLSKYMLGASQIKEEWKSKIPAVVHIDGSARPQSVSRDNNRLYYELIKEFKSQTGIPLITNTSFNLGGEPIVNTFEEALNVFTRANDIDILVINSQYFQRKGKD